MKEDIYTQIARLKSSCTMSQFASLRDLQHHKEGYRESVSDMAELAFQESRLAATPPVLAAPANSAVLPELPEPEHRDEQCIRAIAYTADQLRAYGQACAAAERAAIAKMVDSVGHDWCGALAHAFFDLATAIRART